MWMVATGQPIGDDFMQGLDGPRKNFATQLFSLSLVNIGIVIQSTSIKN